MNGAIYPESAGTNVLAEAFASLSARASQGRMAVSCRSVDVPGDGEPILYASTDAPGHWRARHWQAYRLRRESEMWVALVPLPSVEVPTLYFLKGGGPGESAVSPLRIFHPRRAGLTRPARPFTGFVDGFEEGADDWELVSGTAAAVPLTISNEAWSGRSALRMEIAPRRGSVTVGTARIRGWMLVEHQPAALELVARTEGGPGRLLVMLHSNARTQELRMHPAGVDFELGPEWRRVEVPLTSFAGRPGGDVDWFTLQFFGEPGSVLVVDDVEWVLP